VSRVLLPTHLRQYSAGEPELDAIGATLGDVIADLETRHPGLRVRIVDEQDRIRPHIKCFVAGEQVRDLGAAVLNDADVQIIAALSGG
jgi:molybdopterin synthase sulfur carrier subunit